MVITDLGLATLGFRVTGCKFAPPPTVGRKTQICNQIHANLESQIPCLNNNINMTTKFFRSTCNDCKSR